MALQQLTDRFLSDELHDIAQWVDLFPPTPLGPPVILSKLCEQHINRVYAFYCIHMPHQLPDLSALPVSLVLHVKRHLLAVYWKHRCDHGFTEPFPLNLLFGREPEHWTSRDHDGHTQDKSNTSRKQSNAESLRSTSFLSTTTTSRPSPCAPSTPGSAQSEKVGPLTPPLHPAQVSVIKRESEEPPPQQQPSKCLAIPLRRASRTQSTSPRSLPCPLPPRPVCSVTIGDDRKTCQPAAPCSYSRRPRTDETFRAKSLSSPPNNPLSPDISKNAHAKRPVSLEGVKPPSKRQRTRMQPDVNPNSMPPAALLRELLYEFATVSDLKARQVVKDFAMPLFHRLREEVHGSEPWVTETGILLTCLVSDEAVFRDMGRTMYEKQSVQCYDPQRTTSSAEDVGVLTDMLYEVSAVEDPFARHVAQRFASRVLDQLRQEQRSDVHLVYLADVLLQSIQSEVADTRDMGRMVYEARKKRLVEE